MKYFTAKLFNVIRRQTGTAALRGPAPICSASLHDFVYIRSLRLPLCAPAAGCYVRCTPHGSFITHQASIHWSALWDVDVVPVRQYASSSRGKPPCRSAPPAHVHRLAGRPASAGPAAHSFITAAIPLSALPGISDSASSAIRLSPLIRACALGTGQKPEWVFRKAGHVELFGDEAAQTVAQRTPSGGGSYFSSSLMRYQAYFCCFAVMRPGTSS